MHGKGNTTQRGYGNEHMKLRRAWKPHVEQGQVNCHAVICLHRSRLIQPGTAWHLGHTPDRRAWTGPEHAKCNLTEAAKRGNLMRQTRARLREVTTLRW